MLKIEEMGVKSRTEAAKVLAEYEKAFLSYQYIVLSLIRVSQDVSVQQFLLTNLVVPPASSPDKVKF